MDATMKIAVILTAFDKMSDVINGATNNAEKKLSKLAKANFVEGGALIGTGIAITASMGKAVQAYSRLEDASIDLKASMMESTGAIDGNFEKINALAESLGDKLPGATADFDAMFMTMMNNGVKSQNVLNGVGKAAAYLAVDLKMPYTEAGEFAARMKEATGTADEEMLQFMDTISRANALGVKAGEMQYAFGRSAGSLKMLGLQGLQASNDMTVLYASLIRAGQTGETSASSFNNIIQSLLNKDKFAKFSGMAKEIGIGFEFFKDGKFLGIENMIAQFDKMKDLTTTRKAQLINVLTGGGQDGQALSTLINNGTAGYQRMRAEMEKKASLNDKVNLKLQTLTNLWEATTGTIENMLAALGAGLAPILGPIVEKIGELAGKVKEFLSANPALAKFISMMVTLTGVAVMVAGVIKVIQGIRAAMMLLNITMAANPFILVAMAAILAVSLIYANWDKIKAWFINLWAKVKQIFSKAWEWIKNIFLNYTPHGLIIKHWDKIKAFFIGIWDSVKNTFKGWIDWIMGLGGKFVDAGKNIVNSIWEGIKAMANKPVEAIKDIVTKVRRFLPFSPAKDGPLKDIHKIKLVETIAESMKPQSLLQAISKVTTKAREMLFGSPVGIASVAAPQVAGGFGGGGMTMNFHFTLNGSATQADANMITSEVKKQIGNYMKQHDAQKKRVSF